MMRRLLGVATILWFVCSLFACDDDNGKRHSDNSASQHDNYVSQDNWSPEKRALGQVFDRYCEKMKACYEAVEPNLEYPIDACLEECTMITDLVEDEACVASFSTVYTCLNDEIPCSTFFSDKDETEADEELRLALNQCADKSPAFRGCKDAILEKIQN